TAPDLRNGTAFAVDDIPRVTPEGLRRAALAMCAEGGRIAAFFALPIEGKGAGHDVFVVVAEDGSSRLRVLCTRLDAGAALVSLSAELAQAQAFERELHELHGLSITGHPWLKPLRAHAGLAGGSHPFF